jgi:hypothetical protein
MMPSDDEMKALNESIEAMAKCDAYHDLRRKEMDAIAEAYVASRVCKLKRPVGE